MGLEIREMNDMEVKMGLFRALTKTAIDVVTTPADIVADVITGFGMCTERDEPYTVSKLKRIYEDIEKLPESLD
ncbi:MAG: hypothetical protein D6732_03010 [Methanobacteriota archaeon]|nr:MAG: hypothetical protein D6732_03010 [Euryarchaeota archaeon]